MLELILSLLNDEGDDDAGDEGQRDRDYRREVEGLRRANPTLEDVKDGEGRGNRVQLNCLRLLLPDGRQDRVIHVLGEVGHRLLTGCIDEHIHLEVVLVISLDSFVDLVGAEAERLRIANVLLFIYSLVIVFVRYVGLVVVGD